MIRGTELVAFSALLTCRHAGIKPLAMVEPGTRITARSPAIWLARLLGVPVRLKSEIATIRGRARVDGVTLATETGPQDLSADGVIVTGGFRPDAALLRGSHLAVDPASGGPVIDRWGRLSDPAYFAAGNLLRGVETAGWCWSEGKRTARAVSAALEGRLPKPGGARITLAHAALRLAVPQILGAEPASGDTAHDLLQIRLDAPAKGHVRLTQDGHTLASSRLDSLPERRLSLPMPAVSGTTPVILAIEEQP